MDAEQAEARKLATFLEKGQMLAGPSNSRKPCSRVAMLARHHGMMRGAVMLLDQDTNVCALASHGLDEDGARRVNVPKGEGILTGELPRQESRWCASDEPEPMFLDRLGAREESPEATRA